MEVGIKKLSGLRVERKVVEMVKSGGKGEDGRLKKFVECVVMDGM